MKSFTGPLVLWLTLQLLALLFAATRLPLSAHYPHAGETLTLQMMVIVQTIALALLAPLLLRSISSTVAIALTAGPMLQLAGVLAQVPMARAMLVWANVSLWAVGLFLWTRALNPRRQMLVVAVASTLTLGGVILWYLNAEFANASSSLSYWSPTVAAIRLARGAPPHHLAQWAVVVGILIAGAVSTRVARRSNRSHS